MDAVQGRAIAYWFSQPFIAALLLGVMLGVERLRLRRRDPATGVGAVTAR